MQQFPSSVTIGRSIVSLKNPPKSGADKQSRSIEVQQLAGFLSNQTSAGDFNWIHLTTAK